MADKYASFEELRENEVEGEDFDLGDGDESGGDADNPFGLPKTRLDLFHVPYLHIPLISR